MLLLHSMSLESEIFHVLQHPNVEAISFSESTNTVKITYQSYEFFNEWPHGAEEGTREQKEAYFQNQLGVDWYFVTIETNSPAKRSSDSQVAILQR